MKRTLVFISFYILTLFACEEAFDFETYDDPIAYFQFIDADSINQLQVINDLNEDSLGLLELTQDQLDSSLLAISDSIDALTIARDSGNFSFEALRADLNSIYSEDSTSLSRVLIHIAAIESLTDSLTLIQGVLNEGNLILDYVKPQFGVAYTETYSDSTDTYLLALNTTDTVSTYLIGISEEEYSVSLSHQNEEFVTADLGVKISISQIDLFETSFDSITVSCPTNCTANGTTIICYY